MLDGTDHDLYLSDFLAVLLAFQGHSFKLPLFVQQLNDLLVGFKRYQFSDDLLKFSVLTVSNTFRLVVDHPLGLLVEALSLFFEYKYILLEFAVFLKQSVEVQIVFSGDFFVTALRIENIFKS